MSRSTDVVRDYESFGKALFLGFFVFCSGFIMAGRPVKNVSLFLVVDASSSFFCFVLFTVVCYSGLGLMHGTFMLSFLFPLKMVEFSPPEIRSASTKIGRGAGVML